MVEQQLQRRGIHDQKVLEIMAQLPRQHFIPPENHHEAYYDQPVPIGFGQTISQPYIVALMTEKLDLASHHRVLEIGTGCGYQTAILARLASRIYTIERIEQLARRSRQNLAEPDLQINNVEFHIGDGCLGWPEPMEFDRILIAAATDELPEPLLSQLAQGGKLVAPVRRYDGQQLLLLQKHNNKMKETFLCYCRFVELIRG